MKYPKIQQNKCYPFIKDYTGGIPCQRQVFFIQLIAVSSRKICYKQGRCSTEVRSKITLYGLFMK